jgi:APA family basic amino acid/polyamine antiporter
MPDTASAHQPSLVRSLGTGDAVVIGLGSMVGAGVFGVFGPAARVAGAGLLLGLLVAAGVAYCNAVASAQLAAAYPTSGGTYLYGRERLGPWWGFTAGWGFVVGKVASCAAMALTFAAYAVPGPAWAGRLVAVAAVIGLSGLNYRGVARTALVTRLLVALAIAALLVVVLAVWAGHPQHTDSLDPGGWFDTGGVHGVHGVHGVLQAVYGVLQAAGLIFFAFAGYARIATLGEEVKDPQRTIVRAIPLALGITVVVYVAVAVSAFAASGPTDLGRAGAPLAAAVHAVGAGSLTPVVRFGAAVASLGSLLALIAGIGRTALAMARGGDLPGWLAAVHPRFRTPHHAEVAVAAVVVLLVMTTDLRGVIGFSSFGILVYYGIANASAFTQPREQRRWPRCLNVVGAVACAVLVVSLPLGSVVTGLVMFAVGLGGRLVVSGRRRTAARPGRLTKGSSRTVPSDPGRPCRDGLWGSAVEDTFALAPGELGW